MYCKIGQYVGTGGTQSINTGWTPDVVFVLAANGINITIHGRGMVADTYMLMFGGQNGFAADPSVFKTLDANGFTVGSSLNVAATTYTYMILKSGEPKDIGTLLWSGQVGAPDSRNLTGLGFQPDVIYATSNSAFAYNRLWHKDRGGDSAGTFRETESWVADHIQGVSADGFQVGTAYNQNATNYCALCFKQSLNCEVNFFLGDGTGNRNISMLNIVNPAFILGLARFTASNLASRGPYRSRFNSVNNGYQINSGGESTQSWTAFGGSTATIDTFWNNANLALYYFAFSEQDAPPDTAPIDALPEILGGGAGGMIPFAPYQRYKALRALGQELNNVVLGP